MQNKKKIHKRNKEEEKRERKAQGKALFPNKIYTKISLPINLHCSGIYYLLICSKRREAQGLLMNYEGEEKESSKLVYMCVYYNVYLFLALCLYPLHWQ